MVAGMPLVLLYFLICLNVYWYTYLAVASKFPLVYRPRRFLIGWLDPRDSKNRKVGKAPIGGFGRAIGFLLGCEWCTSAYSGAAVIYVTTRYMSVPVPFLLWGAVCVFTGVTANLLGWGEEKWRLNMTRRVLLEDDLKARGYEIPEDE